MKKSQIFTIVAGSIAAILLTGVLIIGLQTDGFTTGIAAGPDGPKHQNQVDIALDADEVLEEVEVSWVAGQVELGRSQDEDIHIIESAHREIGEEDQMQASFSGGKLSVRWDGKWFRKWINWGIFNFGNSGKDLQILLPESSGLLNMQVSNTSGEILAQGFSAGDMAFSSTSGDLILRELQAAEGLALSTVSGDMELENIVCGELAASTTSGEMELKGLQADSAAVSTTSGDFQCEGTVNEIHASTVSGEVDFELANRPVEVEMESVSGGLALGIPRNEGFIASFSSVSGEFETDFGEASGKKSGSVRYGSGGAEFDFNTTSGDMKIYQTN